MWKNKCGSGSYPRRQLDSRRTTWGHMASRHLKALMRVAEEGTVASWGYCPVAWGRLSESGTQVELRLVVVECERFR